MIDLSLNYTVDQSILECDFLHYTPPSLNVVIGEKSQVFIDLPREDGGLPLKDRYFELDYNVTRPAAGLVQYADADHARILKLGPIFLKKI